MMDLTKKYSRPEDDDICESLTRALESGSDSERQEAVAALIALDDLYAASRIYWLAKNGNRPVRMAAVKVLGNLCRDTYTLHTLADISQNDPNRYVRQAATEFLENAGFEVSSEGP